MSASLTLHAREYARRLDAAAPGLTVREAARRLRVGEDKIRKWIRNREIHAVNTAALPCGRPRWVIPADALAAFESSRTAAPPPAPPRRRRAPAVVDYYPD